MIPEPTIPIRLVDMGACYWPVTNSLHVPHEGSLRSDARSGAAGLDALGRLARNRLTGFGEGDGTAGSH
jgi:hypothetical protein